MLLYQLSLAPKPEHHYFLHQMTLLSVKVLGRKLAFKQLSYLVVLD